MAHRDRPAPADRASARLKDVPWSALSGLCDRLASAIADVLAGAAAERVVGALLRSHPHLGADARRACAEAVFGVGLWRRRLEWHAGGDRSPRVLLASLLRDLGGASTPDAEVLAGLARGALSPKRPAPPDLALRASLPDWLALELQRAIGDEADALADALNVPGPVFLRANALRTTRDSLAERLAAEGVATRPGRWATSCLEVTSPRPNVLGLPAFRAGLFEVQDEGSQLLGGVLPLKRGAEVLDLCAGAGGKALQLAAAVGDRGRVHACDADLRKLARIGPRASRAGAASIVLHGAAPPPALRVDAALVDAPCSELGPLRRGPDLRFRVDPASFAALPALQLRLLERAARHVRAGGHLAYGTCTFRAEENEGVADAFEGRHAEFERARPAAPAGTVGSDGRLRVLPHRHGTDGFFGAVWVRRR